MMPFLSLFAKDEQLWNQSLSTHQPPRSLHCPTPWLDSTTSHNQRQQWIVKAGRVLDVTLNSLKKVIFSHKYDNELPIVSFCSVVHALGCAASIAIQFSSNHLPAGLCCQVQWNLKSAWGLQNLHYRRLSTMSRRTLTTANQICYLQCHGQIGLTLNCDWINTARL